VFVSLILSENYKNLKGFKKLIHEERERERFSVKLWLLSTVYTGNCWMSENNTKCRWTWNEADIRWMSCTLK